MKWAAARQDQKNDMCVQRRLRSAWASAQSDQGLHCPHEESLGPHLPNERTAKTDHTGKMPRLIWVFAGRTCHFVGFSWGGSYVFDPAYRCLTNRSRCHCYFGYEPASALNNSGSNLIYMYYMLIYWLSWRTSMRADLEQHRNPGWRFVHG